ANLVSQNKFEEAVKNLEKALELGYDEDSDTGYYLAKAYYGLKKYDVVRNMLKYVDIKEDPEALNLLALSHMKLREWAQARDIFKELTGKYPKNHIMLTNLAKCELKLNEFEAAKTYASKALEVFSDFDDAIKILKKVEQNEQ
ncbi:TPR repeat-containing protein, partial [Candidatus Gastranaerophilus sp. (ex Termes propinquus)]